MAANLKSIEKMEIKLHKFTHDSEYHDIVNNKEVLRKTVEKFLNNIIDEISFGIIFASHKKYKTKSFNLDEDDSHIVEEEMIPNTDIFGHNNMKKIQECKCPNCDRTVAATRFAPHLEVCMGMGRNRSRNASRRIASNNSNVNKERDSTTYTGLPSDDEDDADWSSGDKRRKKKHRNGNKKGKESVNVDIEGHEAGDMSLREYMQDHSSSSDSRRNSNSSTSSSKRKEKSKSKKRSKRDRSSPSSSGGD